MWTYIFGYLILACMAGLVIGKVIKWGRGDD